MGNKTITIMGAYFLSYIRYHPNELVSGDGASPWHE